MAGRCLLTESPAFSKHLSTLNRLHYKQIAKLGYKSRWQSYCRIHSDSTISGPNNVTHHMRCLFAKSSANLIYAIVCQPCPSALIIGQTGQSLHKRINGHKSNIRNDNTHKPASEHFSLTWHSINNLNVTVFFGGGWTLQNWITKNGCWIRSINKFQCLKRTEDQWKFSCHYIY